MNEKVLEYAIKEAATALKIMFRDKSTLHVFDLGKGTDEVEYSVIISIAPKSIVDKLPMRESKPLEEIN